MEQGRREPYERFAAWRRCHELVLAVYRTTAGWPSAERYGLVSQARRAAFSAAATLVEGSAKCGPAEFRRYLDMSRGSIAEVGYTLRVARDLEYLDHGAWAAVDQIRADAAALTWRLYRSMSHAATR